MTTESRGVALLVEQVGDPAPPHLGEPRADEANAGPREIGDHHPQSCSITDPSLDLRGLGGGQLDGPPEPGKGDVGVDQSGDQRRPVAAGRQEDDGSEHRGRGRDRRGQQPGPEAPEALP
jgi:hypothetical protein